MSKDKTIEFGGKQYGRNSKQEFMLIAAIKRSEEYVVWHSIDKKTHIIPDQKLHEMLENALEEGKAIGREERGKELMEMLPKERPMSVFSFVLKGEELERYMRYKGFNECRDNIKALLTPQND